MKFWQNIKEKIGKKKEKNLKDYFIIFRPFVWVWRKIKDLYKRAKARHQDFMSRRPHRSLYLTRKRDFRRSWKMPGYFAFANQVWQTIWVNKRIFLKFIILYSVLSLLIAGTLSQSSYLALKEQINSYSEDLGAMKWVTLFTGAITTGSGEEMTATGEVLAGMIFLFGWLVIVWILRRYMAGDKIKLRDALYSAGSPLVATMVLLAIMLFQLVPFVLVLVAYSAFTGFGFINWDISIENMAAWCAVAAAAVLTLYWMTTSFLALIIVTNPGVYPFKAIKMAGDIAVSRRLRIMLRLTFMVLPVAIMWIAILLPVIFLDDFIKVDWLPLVPLFVLILSTLTLLWVATYIYMLYRRLIDDQDPPVRR